MVKVTALRRAILDGQGNALFQVFHADLLAERLQQVDLCTRLGAALLTIVASFSPKLISGNESIWPQILGCVAAMAAVVVSVPKWSLQLRNAIAERERWSLIASEYEALWTDLDLDRDAEKVLARYTAVRDRAMAAAAVKAELPRSKRLRERAENMARKAVAPYAEWLSKLQEPATAG